MSPMLPSLTAAARAAAGPVQFDADIAWTAEGEFCEPETVLPLPDDTLQVTPVGGPLVRLRSDDDIEVIAGDEISSANHGFAPRLGLALIPTGFDNTVIAIRIRGR